MLNLISNSNTAIIVLHEIYGINQHIKAVCNKYFDMGYDVYCPNLLDRTEPFDYSAQNEAYLAFNQQTWNQAYELVERLGVQIKPKYEKVFLMGFSVGAAIAWNLSESNLYDGIISYYGSRIRDNLHIQPQCPTLLIFAKEETSFNPEDIIIHLENKPSVSVIVLDGKHGFSNCFSEHYCASSAGRAEEMTNRFIKEIITREKREHESWK